MNITNLTLYKNEKRWVKLTIMGDDNTKVFPTSGSTYKVVDMDDTEILSESNVEVENDYILKGYIDTTVTSSAGEYYIIWKIINDNGYYYHLKTKLIVEDFFES